MNKPFLALTAVIMSSTMLLSGCQTVKGWIAKRDNGSLDYQSSKKLAPLELPANQETAAFVPLYPTPNVGANTLNLQNAAKKQYQLPKPERAVRLTQTP
ncbi:MULTISPECIES: hypothetical protein [Psychrobacter]|uniref:hypothetical protein n=1 Tax=Psychrobacter TaxID=497 RepID=UPI00146EA80B|nr:MULTISPECIES: hypothetical protein [Psychrobacter]